jgi:outer membrane protein assembly factor BamB
MQIAIAASALPLLVGVGAATAGLARRVPAAVRRAAAAIVAVAIAGAVLLVRHLLSFRDDSVPDTTYLPRLGAWLPLLAASIAIACALPRVRARWIGASFAFVLSGAVAIVVTAATAIEWLASRSSYFAYQLGTPRFGLPSGGVMLGAAGAGLLLNAWWGLRRGESNGSARSSGAPATLAVTTLALGAVFFAATNYATSRGAMVRALVCLDRGTGAVRWTLTGLEGPQAAIDGRNSPATPTAVTDGRVVCGYFGTAGLLCADPSGGRRWSRRDLVYEGSYGAGFSPVLADGTIVVARDLPTGIAIVDAIDGQTGSIRWTRAFDTTPTFSGNSRTPIVVASGGERAVVLWGMTSVTALALADGRSLWSYPYTSSGDLVSSAVADDERLYLSDVTGTVALDLAALAAGRDPVRWRNNARSNCVSPVLANGLFFTVTDSGVATGMRADTGQTVWRQRLPGQYFASLVASADAVYFTNSEGLTTVVAASERFETLARNPLGEETLASIAPSGGELFIRSAGHVYAVGGR